MAAPTAIVRVDEPPPGAAIVAGLKLPVAPAGKPETESATDELKLPDSADVIVAVPAAPCPIVKDAMDESEKYGLKTISMMG